MSDVSLRTYAFIDRLQPQCAAHIAATCQGDVPLAGNAELFIEMAPGNEVFHVAVLAELGLTEDDRVKPEIASAQFITNVHPYQAQLLNKFRKGALLIPGQSLFVLE